MHKKCSIKTEHKIGLSKLTSLVKNEPNHFNQQNHMASKIFIKSMTKSCDNYTKIQKITK